MIKWNLLRAGRSLFKGFKGLKSSKTPLVDEHRILEVLGNRMAYMLI